MTNNLLMFPNPDSRPHRGDLWPDINDVNIQQLAIIRDRQGTPFAQDDDLDEALRILLDLKNHAVGARSMSSDQRHKEQWSHRVEELASVIDMKN